MILFSIELGISQNFGCGFQELGNNNNMWDDGIPVDC